MSAIHTAALAAGRTTEEALAGAERFARIYTPCVQDFRETKPELIPFRVVQMLTNEPWLFPDPNPMPHLGWR